MTEPAFSPLVAPESLADRLDDPRVRFVDLRWVLGEPGRGRAQYKAGHLPGAVFIDFDVDLAAPVGPGRHPLPSPVGFRKRLEAIGIGSDDDVIVYDDAAGSIAARLWWMLDDLGHARVAVLDGGFSAWLAAGFPITTEAPEPRPPGHLRLREAWTHTIDRAAVADGLGSVVLLDARATPRYLGEVEPIDSVAGHIPTAVSAPTTGNLGPDGRMLPPTELAARFRALGAAEADARVVSSCGSGVTACFNILAMRLAGLPDPILYPGSYSDWTQSGMPVAVGPEPGTSAPVRAPYSR